MKSNMKKTKKNDFDFIESQISMIEKEMKSLMGDLFPICRSITGDGVRKTHKIIGNHIKLKTFEIPSGTKVFDWTIPKEWNINDAYVIDPAGKKIIDFKKHNLHLVGYSIPLKKTLTKKDLFKNLYFLKNQPEAIPYITSYYKKRWGFCVSYNQFKQFDKKYSLKDKFQVVINSSLKNNGNLNYGELILKAKSKQEILISTYVCHPSLCNDNISGIVVSTMLAKILSKLLLHHLQKHNQKDH